MQFKDIIYEVKSDYAYVTINRPKVLNAFTPVTLQELKTALDSAEKDKNVGVIVLSGAGDRAFCAGGDMNWESSKEFQDHEYEFHIHLTKCSKPIIAKVDGYAIGGGNHMAYFCDLTIASENSMSGVDKFLPLANCIGDILNQENYELQYIGGSDLDFAGKGNFYKTHGFNIVEGWYELENTLKDKNYRSPWGVYDDELLDIVFKRVQNLHSQSKNFGLFTLTLDTHHPDGYISKSCSNNKYKNGENPILNSVHCVDELVGKFMDKFLVSEMYENTTLVLLSDHLALKNSASDILNKQKRKNLFMIFDKSAKSKSIDAVGNTFDIGPTVMSFIGLNSNGLGLGRNLIINKSLSVENNLDDLIMSNKRKILDLWSFPKIKNGFRISEKDMKIFFGNRFIDFPALIILDIKNEVDQIMFDFYYANPLSNKVKRLKDKSNFLWIDQCSKIYEYKNLNKFHQINDYCILLEDNKSLKFEVMLLDSKNINNEYIKNYFSHE